MRVGEDGFEPPKALPTDLQSAPFGHSGTLPIIFYFCRPLTGCVLRADGGIRTPDQLITNQLLWPTELHRQLVCPDLGLQIYGEIFIPQNFPQQNFKNSFQSFTEPYFRPIAHSAIVQNRRQKYNSFLYKKIIRPVFCAEPANFNYLC